MDGILLTDSDANTLEKIFKGTKKIFPPWDYKFAPETLQRGDSINCLGYKMGLQKIQPQKAQIRKDQLQIRNDF